MNQDLFGKFVIGMIIVIAILTFAGIGAQIFLGVKAYQVVSHSSPEAAGNTIGKFLHGIDEGRGK